jgi:hypothetical protein
MQFPAVSGSNLQREKSSLPNDFAGDFNVLLVAFQRWQQSVIDTWIPFVRQLEKTYPNVRYYELPTIESMNRVARTFINEGMRAGIPDPVARERTITLYLDKSAFRRALGLGSEDDIYILLVDRDGKVLWRAQGAFAREKGDTLLAAIGGKEKRDDAG